MYCLTWRYLSLGLKKKYKSVRLACKKVYFLTAWASQNVSELHCLASIVDIEHGNTIMEYKAPANSYWPSIILYVFSLETSVASWKSNTTYQHQKTNSTANSKLITELS